MIHKNYANRQTYYFKEEPKNVELLFSWLLAILAAGLLTTIACFGWW